LSLTKAVTIWCDATWCYKWENYNNAKAKDTRKSARSDGWVSTKHGDFCCLEHSKGKRTRAEKAQRKYEKLQAKRDPVGKNDSTVPGDNSHSYGGGSLTGTISSLIGTSGAHDYSEGPPF